ncbi:MAG: mevalonate kinase [Candidatus Promineifilaceae bacterium]
MKERIPIKATAPGKIILFGEHAVVYGRPAIAAPLAQIRAVATIHPARSGGVVLIAPDLGVERNLADVKMDDALALTIQQVREAAGLQRLPDMTITVTSEIPIASGLGSGAAITAAATRALARFLNLETWNSDEWVSALTYEVEKIHHGTPSGIDNTVVAYERPVYFVRSEPQNIIETFNVLQPLRLLVGDTGISSSTKVVVGDVRRSWQKDPQRFNALFDGCGAISEAGREAIKKGARKEIGRLMNENHALLIDMTVSSQELNTLVTAALGAGALGAKMSGGGRGGNMIALVTADTEEAVRRALFAAGAVRVLESTVDGRGVT